MNNKGDVLAMLTHSVYSTIYKRLYEGTWLLGDKGKKEQFERFDRMMEEKGSFHLWVCSMVKYRQDPFSSDREILALMETYDRMCYAMVKLGYEIEKGV